MASADYLAKYLSAEDAEQQLGVKKKKRRKKKKAGAAASAAAVKGSSVVIHDENPEWAKAVDAENSDAEDGPVVVELEDATTERPRQREGAGGWSTVDRERRDRSSSSDAPVRRRARHDSDSDSDSDSDAAPKRRRVRHDSDSDSDASPPRRAGGASQRHDSDSDSDSDAAPPRRAARHDSDSDASPPRRGGADSDDDASPPRRRGGSPDSDASPARPPRGGDSRRNAETAAVVEAGTESESDSEDDNVMDNGQSVGLVKRQEISARNAELKRREKEKFNSKSAESLGKNQETVYRDKRGKRLEQLESFMAAGEGVKASAEEEQMEWGTGLVQKRNAMSDADRLAKMKDAPFARYADDKEMNDEMKQVERWGDPMMGMIKKAGGGAKGKGKPRCPHTAPKNRFGIPPGYRWDGVNRTNGFEGRLLRQAKEGEAAAEARYKWSVEDM